MEARMDLLDQLGPNLSSEILTYLEDPSDLFRASFVSRSWRHCVIANGLWKQFCLRMFPQLSRVARVIELNNGSEKELVEVGSSYQMEWESLKRDDRVYALLARYCTSFLVGNCISQAISASSTDNYPEESIENTLQPADVVERRASYWSSKGQSNPAIPETLIYKLASELCVVTEINIRPFQVYFHFGLPICSARSVRFRMGHPKSLADVGSDLPGDSFPGSADDKFVWTYTSQEFPMAQECELQKFKLPEPVLCVGGILQIELLGSVHRCDIDGLFYICISYVQAVGRSLSPAFGVEILEPSGKFVLKNDMKHKPHTHPSLPEDEPGEISADLLQRRLREMLYEFGEEENEAWDADDL
ncbi:F-box protein At4g00755-like [Alnus glutinosa]|uniref:F-box protein At4g00755-like n=1 Tax=Alnus glutinosa TaxID=3517 RepID=UPI002D78AB86|nr:F-box protein At4g00755-like [Alnus glutinosa]XP_062156811.1 F-box protein At4g00755-like [Alnus glutinosa]